MRNPCYSIVLAFLFSCSQDPTGYQGQQPTPVVPTESVPIQKQWRGIWAFSDSTYFTNDFEGARLNGVVKNGENTYTILISAENYPVNPSPWYAFKVWSATEKDIKIHFTYQDSRSRYFPKISRDGRTFIPMDSSDVLPVNPGEDEFGIGAAPEQIIVRLTINRDPAWITAQELYTSSSVSAWIDSLAIYDFVKSYSIGSSTEGRDMRVMEIGNPDAGRAVMVISRQHPPEVTGFLAMKSFVETLCAEIDQSEKFREDFVTYVVPLMNPDGVDNGHWRHGSGGVDLNRDWENFNQKETSNVRDFLQKKSAGGKSFVFGIDFHSTWDDIYYPLDSTIGNQDNGIVYDWIRRITSRLPQKQTNIRPSKTIEPTRVSRNYFYQHHAMPAIVFELGDNTPRDFLEKKGRVAAEELMDLLMMD